MVEADDESTLDFEASALEAFDVSDEVAVGILIFAAFGEAVDIGSFDADEEHGEACADHHLGELGVVGEVDGDLCDKGDGSTGLLPLDESGHEVIFRGGFVADEVVIDEEDGSSPAGVMEGIEFGDDPGAGFDSRVAAEEGGDVAEFAVEGASAGELDAHGGVLGEIGELPERGGREGEVGELAVSVDTSRAATFEVSEEGG